MRNYQILCTIEHHSKQTTGKIKLLMTGLGKQRIILGFPWLNKHNPKKKSIGKPENLTGEPLKNSCEMKWAICSHNLKVVMEI